MQPILLCSFLPSRLVSLLCVLSALCASCTCTVPFPGLELPALGLGLSPPTPDWGLMVSEGVGQISFAPWLVLFPAIFISTLVIGLNFGAEALANALGMDAARGYVGGV